MSLKLSDDDASAIASLRSQLEASQREIEGLRTALKDLYHGYVNNLEAAMDRIKMLGGDCDPVDVMERGDPYLAKARAVLSKDTP